MKTWLQSFALLFGLTLVTGLVYPLVVTGIGWIAWPNQVNGSLILDNNGLRGSLLLSQKSNDPRWFWARPSAGDYATLPSGASNVAPSNKALREQIDKQRALYAGEPALPAEMLLNSGSGLDPHVSPESARLQTARICRARAWDTAQCQKLKEVVESSFENPTFGFLGRARVNVNRLNQSIAEIQE